jgi:uncharacterized protein YeaO (DUF488 family)
MSIVLKRAYENPGPADGYRVLVDRLWPRGISKERADLDEWMREVSPSEELRKWYHENLGRWSEFRRRYLAELKTHRNKLRSLARQARAHRVTLVYASADTEHNNAVVLKQYLKMLGAKD